MRFFALFSSDMVQAAMRTLVGGATMMPVMLAIIGFPTLNKIRITILVFTMKHNLKSCVFVNLIVILCSSFYESIFTFSWIVELR